MTQPRAREALIVGWVADVLSCRRHLKTRRDLRSTSPGDLKARPRGYLEIATGRALNSSPIILEMK